MFSLFIIIYIEQTKMYWYILTVASDDLATLVFIFYEHIFFVNLRTLKYMRVEFFAIQIAQ